MLITLELLFAGEELGARLEGESGLVSGLGALKTEPAPATDPLVRAEFVGYPGPPEFTKEPVPVVSLPLLVSIKGPTGPLLG